MTVRTPHSGRARCTDAVAAPERPGRLHPTGREGRPSGRVAAPILRQCAGVR
jgi:hypothetical protein